MWSYSSYAIIVLSKRWYFVILNVLTFTKCKIPDIETGSRDSISLLLWYQTIDRFSCKMDKCLINRTLVVICFILSNTGFKYKFHRFFWKVFLVLKASSVLWNCLCHVDISNDVACVAMWLGYVNDDLQHMIMQTFHSSPQHNIHDLECVSA